MPAPYLGIDLGVHHISWGLITDELEIVSQGTLAVTCTNLSALLDVLTQVVNDYAADTPCICLSVPGTVLAHDCQGTILGGGRLSYLDGVPLGFELSLATGKAVCVENNGKAAALGEYAAGALRGSQVGVVLVIGSDIGGGIVIDGKVLRGAHDFAGEFSFVRHTPILGETRTRDAMAGLCSWQGLRRSIMVAKGLPDDEEIDGFKLFEWVNAGDDEALRGLHAYAKDLCTWIFNLQCIVDPDVIAISGGISVQPALLEALHVSMRSMMAELQMPEAPKPNIVMAELGADAKLLGAVYGALQRSCTG